MSKRRNELIHLVCALAGLVVVLIGCYVRFTNAQLTETQLLTQYWYLWLIVGVVLFGNMFYLAKREQDKLDRQYESFSNQLKGLSRKDG